MFCDQSEKPTSTLTLNQKVSCICIKLNDISWKRLNYWTKNLNQLKWIEELSARQLLNPDAGAHLHLTHVRKLNEQRLSKSHLNCEPRRRLGQNKFNSIENHPGSKQAIDATFWTKYEPRVVLTGSIEITRLVSWKKPSDGQLICLAVSLGNQWASLLVGQNWGDFPVKTFRPFSCMFITGIGAVCLNQNPAFNWAWTMKTLPWFTGWERSPCG